MIDAATLQFPYSPPSGYTEEYMDSHEHIHEELADRLDILRTGRAPVSMFLFGKVKAGKTALMQQMQDITKRRHGGYPTLYLENKEGRSIMKSMAVQMLAFLDRPPYHERDLDEFKATIRAMEARVDRGYDSTEIPRWDMVELVLKMGEAMKAAGMAFVYFVDDIEMLQSIDLEILVHCTHWTQRRGLPMMFVLSGPKTYRSVIANIRSDGCFLYTKHKVFQGQKSSIHD